MARGRKPVAATDQRKSRATLRVSDAEFEKLRAAAEIAGLPLMRWVRELAIGAAEEMMANQDAGLVVSGQS